MKVYIVASSKDWNKELFHKSFSKYPGNWLYVENNEELNHLLISKKPIFIFFIHWGWIVEEKIYKNFDCIGFHMSDLPYGRGGSPLQNLILEGKKESKLTAFKLGKGIDAGPIYAKEKIFLEGRAADIYKKIGLKSMMIIKSIIENTPEPVAQRGKSTLFKRRTPKQSNLVEHKFRNLKELYDFIRMLDAPSYPKAYIEFQNYRIEFDYAEDKGDMILSKAKFLKIS